MVRSVLQGDEIFLVSFLFVVNQMHIAPEFAEPVLAEKELRFSGPGSLGLQEINFKTAKGKEFPFCIPKIGWSKQSLL